MVKIASREDVVPADGGGWRNMALHVVGEFEPKGVDYKDDDPSRSNALTMLSELESVYGRDAIYSSPYSYGLMEAVDFVQRLVIKNEFLNVMARGHELLLGRLGAIRDIEAVFYTHNWHDHRKRLVNQDGKPVSDGEAFTFAFRRGLVYALEKVAEFYERRQPPARGISGYLAIPKFMASFGCFAREQTNWVENELPRLQAKYADRPAFGEVDLLSSSGYGSDLLEKISGVNFENTGFNRSEAILKRFYENRKLVDDLTIALRRDSVLFHMFRLGFGRVSLVAKKTNDVFNHSVEPVHVCYDDVIEVIRAWSKVGSTASGGTWIVESADAT